MQAATPWRKGSTRFLGSTPTWAFSRTKLNRANGLQTDYTYDAASQVTQIDHADSSAATTFMAFNYTYSDAGNRTQVAESSTASGVRTIAATVTWDYDAAYQLTHEKRAGNNTYDITYTYDNVGNRLTKLTGGVTTTSTYDAGNQLTKSQDNTGLTTYTYDNAGNLTTTKVPAGGLTTNTWDDLGRMTRVHLASGTRNTFTFNGDGLRVKREDSTGTLKQIWDGQNILQETNNSDVTQAIYTLAPAGYGHLLSQRRSTTTSYYHFDALGSASRLTDASKVQVATYVYEAFGSIKASSGSVTNPFRWIGQLGYYYDTDLLEYYLRARFYDPRVGRFVSRDPLSLNEIEILYEFKIISIDTTRRRRSKDTWLPIRWQQSLVGWHSYAENDPTNLFDPSGMLPFFNRSYDCRTYDYEVFPQHRSDGTLVSTCWDPFLGLPHGELVEDSAIDRNIAVAHDRCIECINDTCSGACCIDTKKMKGTVTVGDQDMEVEYRTSACRCHLLPCEFSRRMTAPPPHIKIRRLPPVLPPNGRLPPVD